MQSESEPCVWYSCYETLRNAVMGCCYSICHKENESQENVINERTHLLEVPEQPHEAPVPVMSASTPPRKPDEQSALNRILHETATNVIDVGALGPYALEPAVYQERVRAYSARLANVQTATVAPPRLLADVSHSERAQILAAPPPNANDIMLINTLVKKAAAAISELHVQHHEELVVPFRVP